MTLAANLERALEAPVTIAFRADASEIPLERAGRDIFFLQVRGESGWRILGNKKTACGEDEAQEFLLRDGDALYVPAGWWLIRRESSDDARELLVRIHSPTGKDLVHWLVDLLEEEEFLRAPLPRFAGPEVRADYLTNLRQSLRRGLWDPGLLERFRRQRNRSAPRADGAAWTPATPEHYLISLALPRPPEIRRVDSETICVLAAQQSFLLPEAAAPLLLYLRDQAPIPISRFYSCFENEFEREELADFLASLSRGGLLLTIAVDQDV